MALEAFPLSYNSIFLSIYLYCLLQNTVEAVISREKNYKVIKSKLTNNTSIFYINFRKIRTALLPKYMSEFHFLKALFFWSLLIFLVYYGYALQSNINKMTGLFWAPLGEYLLANSSQSMTTRNLNYPAGLWKFSSRNIPSSIRCKRHLTSGQTALYFIGKNVISEEAYIHGFVLDYFYFLTGW